MLRILVVVAVMSAGCGGVRRGGDAGIDAGADGGADGGASLGLDGGRREAAWRSGRPPITDDVEGWYVPPEASRVLYPDTRHSPLTPAMAERLRNVALHGQGLNDAVFMKVGDSITASGYFLGCFDGDINNASPSWSTNIDLAGRTSLAETIFHFRSAPLGRAHPFTRESRSARAGQHSGWPLSGLTPPLEIEFEATRAQFAVVMFGTNDLGGGGSATAALEAKLGHYPRNLLAITDWLLARGVVPVLSTIPPRNDEPEYLGLAEVMNTAVRAVAQGRQVPLVDFHQSLLPLVELGLTGDGVHPNIESYNTGCNFQERGLGWGYNQRNLLTLEALDRLMRVVVDGAPGPDASGATLAGRGSREVPFVVPSLPFADLRDVRSAPGSVLDGYRCSGAKPNSGGEFVYEVTLTEPTRLRAAVVDANPLQGDGGVVLDVDLHVLDGSRQASACLASGESSLVTHLEAGTYTFVVDQAVDALAGEFALVIVPCGADDRLCASQAP